MAKPSSKAKKPAAKPRNKGGRPTTTIDIKELEKLAALQCTQSEAAAWFDCSLATIKRRLTEAKHREAWERGQGRGLTSLRRTQFRLAESNAAMAIFLGKNYLGQRDKHEHELEVDGKLEVTWQK